MLADSPTGKSSSPSKEQLCPNDNCSLNSSQDLGSPVDGSLACEEFRMASGADHFEGPEKDEKVGVPKIILFLNRGLVTSANQFLFVCEDAARLRKMSVSNASTGRLLSDLTVEQLSKSYRDAEKIKLTVAMVVGWTDNQKAEFEAIHFRDTIAYHQVIANHKKRLEELFCASREPRPTRSSASYFTVRDKTYSTQIEFLFDIRNAVILKMLYQQNAATQFLLSDLEMIDLVTSYNNIIKSRTPWNDNVTADMMNALSEEQRQEYEGIATNNVDKYLQALFNNKWRMAGRGRPNEICTHMSYEELRQQQLFQQRESEVIKARLMIILTSRPDIYRRNMDDELRLDLWFDYNQFFPANVRECPTMPDHEWNEVCDAIQRKKNEILDQEQDEHLPSLRYYGDYSRVPRGYYWLFSQDVEQVLIRGQPHPVMSLRFVEVALFYTPNTFMQLARKWSRKHRGPNFSLMEAKRLACEDFKTMSPALLRYIYIFARVLATPHGTRPGNIPDEQLCHSCWDKGSHYTNECIRNYTRELREASRLQRGMCGICGQWNVHSSHDVQCSHCVANHASKLCSSSSMWFRYNIRFFDMWLIYSATMSWTVQEWRNLMDNLIRLSQANPESPNFYRYNFATDGNAAEMNLPVNHEYEDEIRAAMD